MPELPSLDVIGLRVLAIASGLVAWFVSQRLIGERQLDAGGEWKLVSSGTWTTVAGLTTTSYPLTGLAANTAYNFQVMTVCSGGSSIYATAANFTTRAAACGVPTNLAAGSITSTGATLSWAAVGGAVSYSLQWKLGSGSTWTTVSGLAGTSYVLTGLSAATFYNFKVMTVCNSNSSTYATAVNFNTSAASCTDNYEPNNAQNPAPQLTPSVAITALISSGTDIDWFQFTNTTALWCTVKWYLFKCTY